MITVRRSSSRGTTRTDWLVSRHSFSFNEYYDPAYTRFGPLVVLNDDIVQPGTGFGLHPHKNAEIVTYVLEGELEHTDSTGKREVIGAGGIGRMSAGKGVVHSEYNHSAESVVRFLQIWLLPKTSGTAPSHEQLNLTKAQRTNVLLSVASDRRDNGGALMNSDATVYISHLEPARELTHEFRAGRGGYIFIADGALSVNGARLNKGDAATLTQEDCVTIRAERDSEFVFFDVAL
jgi:redox-sensitive bicupin YhaK (pirin superfamily)